VSVVINGEECVYEKLMLILPKKILWLAGCYNLVYINFVTPVAISAHSQTLSSFYTFLDPIYLKFLQVC